MRRNGYLKRSPIRRRTRLRPRSAKRAAIASDRAALVQRVLTERPRCEVVDQGVRCLRNSEHVHEPLSRARGGSILEMANTVAICATHHRYLHDHPEWATEHGLLLSQFSPTGAEGAPRSNAQAASPTASVGEVLPTHAEQAALAEKMADALRTVYGEGPVTIKSVAWVLAGVALRAGVSETTDYRVVEG